MQRPPTATKLPAWLPIAGLLVITVLAALVRLWNLPLTPPGFHFDESFEGLEAWRILTDPDYRPIFLRGNFGVPVAFAYLSAGMFWIFEQFGAPTGPLAMRTVAALTGIISVPALAGLTREFVHYGLLPRRMGGNSALFAALMASAALAGMRWHVHFSRMGIEPILGPLLWAAALWTLLRGLRVLTHNRAQGWILLGSAGLFTAAAMYTYQAIWILPFIVAAAAGIILLHSRSVVGSPQRRERVLGLVFAGGLALILVLPLALLFLREPALVFTRPTQVIAGEGNDRTLLENTVATLGMFLPFGQGDLDPRRNVPGLPALHWLWSIPFWLGALVGLRNIRRPAWLILWTSWLGLLLPGVVTEYAPHYHRILAAAGPTAVFMGVGTWQLAVWLGRGVSAIHTASPARSLGALVAGLLLLAGGIWDAQIYFNRWAPRTDLYHAFDEGLWEIGQWAARQTDHTVFISPRGAEHTTLAFAWRTLAHGPEDARHAAPIAYDGRHVLPVLAHTEDAGHDTRYQDTLYIVIDHEDFRSGLLLPSVFPTVTPVHTFYDRAGEPYATVWQRPAAMPVARMPGHPVPSQTTANATPPTENSGVEHSGPDNSVALADGIYLRGYDLQPATLHPGTIAYIQLYWETRAMPTRDWTVYLHILPATGATHHIAEQIVAQHDAQPGQGTLPTTRWHSGWLILDEHQVWLPDTVLPGEYRVRVGLYPAGDPQAASPPPIDLGSFTVESAP